MSLSAHTNTDLPTVPVCLQWTGIDFTIIHYGEWTASSILKQIGVQLQWSCTESHGVRIQFLQRADPSVARDTLAFALPYAKTGVRIFVLNDRISRFLDERDPAMSGRFLGHVLAHEIGHVLSGVATHADEGLMRAHWTEDDFLDMRIHLLKFTKEDTQLIRSNLDGPLLWKHIASNR